MRGVPFPGLSFGGAYEDTYSVGQTCEVFPAAVDASNLRPIAVVFILAPYDLWRCGDGGSSVL